MKFLVFSDSHEYTNGMDTAIEQHKDITRIIHCGDMASDVYYLESVYGNTHSICAVRGNNDFSSPEPLSRVAKVPGHRIFITHGHRQHVKSSLYELIAAARAENCDICIFGHTHTQFYEYKDGLHILNPGSIGYFKMQYAVIDASENSVDVKLYKV